MEKRNIFISFSFDSSNEIKDSLATFLREKNLGVDYSEKTDYSGYSDEMIWSNLETRIKGSSITLVILSKDLVTQNKGEHGYDFKSSGWVYREISASLRDWNNNRINGVILLVPDNLYNEVRITQYLPCNACGKKHTTLSESLLNKIILRNTCNVKQKFRKSSCGYNVMHDSYISIVKMTDFINDPKYYLDNAFEKRRRQIENKEFEIEYDLHNKR